MRLHVRSGAQPKEIDVHFAGARKDAKIEASESSGGQSNYLIGRDPTGWKTHIPQYGRLTYRGVYPGVDLTIYGTNGRLEHDFVLQPGADYRQIRLEYEGAQGIAISKQGDLLLETAEGELIVRAPHIYQVEDGDQQQIDGAFVLQGKNQVSFKIGAYWSARRFLNQLL